MRLSVLTLIFTLFATCVFSQRRDPFIQLSENITTETKNIIGFDKIDVSVDFQVYIRFSDTVEKVEIEANENLHELIEVKKDGETLKIKSLPYNTSNSLGKRRGAEERLVAHITVKRLTAITGDEDVVFELKDKLFSDKLTIKLNEDCILNGYLEVQDLVVDLQEDSELHIEGSAKTMEVDANEDSIIDGADFIVGKLKIDLNEDSEAKLTVNGDIDLKARDDSYFHYKGDGDFVRKSLRGDSEVRSLR